MKFISIVLALIVSSQAFAHVDHALGEDHTAYHIAFGALVVLVAFKGIAWLSTKKKEKKK